MSGAAKTGQLGRNAAVYGGALLLPRLAAFVALIVFSRLLTPAEYGYFALFVISAELMNMVLFNWIRLAFLRLNPEHEGKGRQTQLRRTCLTMTGLTMVLSVPMAMAMAFLATPDRWFSFFLLLMGMNFANGVVRLRLAELQAQERSLSYFAIEVTRATLSLALSLILVEAVGPTFESLSIGFTAANMGVAVVCLAPFVRDLGGRLGLDRVLVKSIVSYAGPIVPITVLESFIPLVERYVVQFVAGPAAVGVYAAAQNLVQQPINMLASAVALAAFPIIMRSAETGGNGGAQARMREVGGLLIALGLPAVAGIIMLRTEIATVLGEEFRSEAIMLMPWVAVTALLINLKYHYFDMAFHVTRRLMVQVATLLPATLLTAPLIYFFLKTWGLPGAAAGACFAFAASLATSWLVGRRLLAIPHAVSEIARIATATAVMVVVLAVIGPLPGILGLAVLVAAGGAAYVVTAVALNALNLRTVFLDYWGRLLSRPVGAA